MAFLVAMGLAVSVVSGAALSGVASGAMQRALKAAGVGQGTEILAEQRRQALALLMIQTSLGQVRSDVGTLFTRTDRLALANSELAASQRANMNTVAAERVDPPGPSASAIELTALRTSIDAHDQRNREEFAAVNKRIDWLENLVYSREATGSVQPAPKAPPRRRIAKPGPRWYILHAEDGVAVIGGKMGTIDVTPGFEIPDLGRVSAVEQRDGHWVVVTEKATIRER